MIIVSEAVEIRASAEVVFAHVDDIRNRPPAGVTP
jgi:hypothetical protein